MFAFSINIDAEKLKKAGDQHKSKKKTARQPSKARKTAGDDVKKDK